MDSRCSLPSSRWLLCSLVYARRQVGMLQHYLQAEDRPTRSGAPTRSFTGLLASLFRWSGKWWKQNKRPMTLILRVVILGYAVPLLLFFCTAAVFTVLFPGARLITESLEANESSCPGRLSNVFAFMWHQFLGGISLGIPETVFTGYLTSPAITNDPSAIAFIASFRLYVMWAGSISIIQMLGQLSLRRLENLLLGAWYRISKYLKRTLAPSWTKNW